MDTKKKIISAGEAAAVLTEGNWTVVVGLFDPMTAVDAQRLGALGCAGRVLAVVLEEEGALLDASARAALTAALRDVSAVTISRPENWRTMIPERPAVRILEEFKDDTKRREAFVELVLSRH